MFKWRKKVEDISVDGRRYWKVVIHLRYEKNVSYTVQIPEGTKDPQLYDNMPGLIKDFLDWFAQQKRETYVFSDRDGITIFKRSEVQEVSVKIVDVYEAMN